jgi:hypothetical protein
MNLETNCDFMGYIRVCLASVLCTFTQIQPRGWVQIRSKRFDHYQRLGRTI